MLENTYGNRKVLLIYDGYRARLRYRYVNIFRELNIMIYCIPSRTSGETKSLDLKLFSPFKSYLNVFISVTVNNTERTELEMFDMQHYIIKAYNNTFISKNMYLFLINQ